MVNRITRRDERLERSRACSYPCPDCGWPDAEKTLRIIYPDQDEDADGDIKPCPKCHRDRVLTVRFVAPDRSAVS